VITELFHTRDVVMVTELLQLLTDVRGAIGSDTKKDPTQRAVG
jgi:hypothetical protein